MSDTVWATIDGGIAGVVTGGLSSLIAPWANWQIDKRRQRLKHKQYLVALWRDMLGSVLKDCEANPSKGYYWSRIERHPTFTSLRPQLKSETYQEMKQIGIDEECHMFLVKKVGEIERKWELL